MMTPSTTALACPAPGSAWQWPRPGRPRPLNAGTVGLAAMQSAPFWARRYTRWFLDSCQGLSTGTAETAELLVSELVTNALQFSEPPAPTLGYSGWVNARLISLSLRHFPESLLIEVFDTDTSPPVLAEPDDLRRERQGIDAGRCAEHEMVVLLSGRRRQGRLLLHRDTASVRPVRDWIRHGPDPTR